jgi:hypothetical protein
MIHFVYGRATLDGEPLRTVESAFPHMKAGQVFRTEGGRAEVLLSPSAFLRVSENSSLRMVDTRLEESHVDIDAGVALVEVVSLPKSNRIRVGVGETVTELRRAGLYRFDAGARTLSVYRGEAELRAGDTTVKAKRGKQVLLEAGLAVSKFDTNDTDTLHRWAARRSLRLALASRATRRASRWSYMGMGWMWSGDYGMSFRSARAAPTRQPRPNPAFQASRQ